MKRKELAETLELASRALADPNAPIPIFKCFCFNKGRVTAYNDVIGISAPCEVEENFAVSGRELLGLLTNSRADELTFVLEDQDVVIKTGRSTFRLAWFPESDFLFSEPDGIWPLQFTIYEDLLAGLSACLMTCAKDTTAPALQGITLNTPYLYSCDGDALTQYNVKIKGKGEQYTMPTDFCETLLKICSDTECIKGGLSVSPEWAMAELANGYKIYGRMIEVGDTPFDHEAHIKRALKNQTPEYTPIPKGLNLALARARVLADAESHKTKLTVEKGKLKLLTETHVGTVRDVITVEKHPELELAVSAEKMQRAISITSKMALLENVTVYQGERVQLILGNMT